LTHLLFLQRLLLHEFFLGACLLLLLLLRLLQLALALLLRVVCALLLCLLLTHFLFLQLLLLRELFLGARLLLRILLRLLLRRGRRHRCGVGRRTMRRLINVRPCGQG
jgi:hypothetical protein